MKSKPQSTRVAKTPTLRKSAIIAPTPPSARNGHRNGNAAGNGHATGRGRKAPTVASSRREVLDGQPPIHQILAAAGTLDGEQHHAALDKAVLLNALVAFRKGDFSVRMPVDLEGVDGKIADAFNEAIEQNQRLSHELERLSRAVG